MRLANNSRQRAQTMVESAIAIGVLIIVVLGIVDFGRAYSRKESVADAVHRGLRYAEIYPTRWTGSNSIQAEIQKAPDVAVNDVNISGTNSGIDITYYTATTMAQCGSVDVASGTFTGVTVSDTTSTCPVSGNVVEITVQSRLNLLTPIVQVLFPGGALVVNLSAEAPIE